MANTFNRRPLNVNIPSSSDIKQYFFNQYNWKGITDTTNFLAVDQETFSDANNVYVNEEGMLRSRPCVKIKTIKINNNGQDVILSDIVDVWVFDYVTVYHSKDNNDYYLTFVNSNTNEQIQVPTVDKIKLIVEDEKIFVFSETSFNYYDMKYTNKDKSYLDATKFIHVPVTTVITDGISTSTTEVESKNIFTESYIVKYLYTSTFQIDFNNLVGKDVTIEIDGMLYNITFEYNNQLVFLSRYTVLSDYNFSDEYIYGPGGENIPFVEVSDDGNMIVSSYSCSIDAITKKPTIDWLIYHTVDGVIFDKVPDVTDVVGSPKISKDGNYCFIFKNDGPYVYSLRATEEGLNKKYEKWTNLLEHLEGENAPNLSLNTTRDVGNRFNKSIVVNSVFIDDTIFAFTYGTSLAYDEGNDPSYKDLYCYWRNGEQSYSKQLLHETSGYCTYTTPSLSLRYTKGKRLEILINVVFQNITNTNYKRAVAYMDNNIEVGNDLEWVSISENDIDNVRYSHTLKNITFIGEKGIVYSDIILNGNTKKIYIYTSERNIVSGEEVWERYVSTLLEESSILDIKSERIIMNNANNYIVTSDKLFTYSSYTENKKYTGLNLFFKCIPVCYNSQLYVSTKDALYKTTTDVLTTISELKAGKTNYLLPSFNTKLENHYIAKDNLLYISSPSSEIVTSTDGITKKISSDFKWYFPKVSEQKFDYNITNLHPISNREVAVFFENSISYVTWDSDISAYRYFKSKLQAGCKNGSDVITSYDGKYVIFPSERGLVAITYQEFTATTEPILTYLSDSIFNTFQKYIFETGSLNEIKLFKDAFWIYVYKNDSNKLLMFDVRNNSWWPLTYKYNVQKIVKNNNNTSYLLNGNMYSCNKDDLDYYDMYDNKEFVNWYMLSQKLHLSAINYYKHITNITFTSVHDVDKLQNAKYNIEGLSFKLQVNNYRKNINGNINDVDDYVVVNYNISSAKTYVQRLNYSKVNEFQYLLSSDEQNAINIPLSLNSITIKYRVSNQVR